MVTVTDHCIIVMIKSWFLLGVDDLGQAVSPHAALCLGAGLQHTLLPRLQSPHS